MPNATTPQRPSARQRGYSAAWDKARVGYLKAHPACIMCAKAGLQTPAAVVDHIKPHRGNQLLFWDRANWQPLCRTCHNGDKRAIEMSGRVRHSVGADGWPVG